MIPVYELDPDTFDRVRPAGFAPAPSGPANRFTSDVWPDLELVRVRVVSRDTELEDRVFLAIPAVFKGRRRPAAVTLLSHAYGAVCELASDVSARAGSHRTAHVLRNAPFNPGLVDAEGVRVSISAV